MTEPDDPHPTEPTDPPRPEDAGHDHPGHDHPGLEHLGPEHPEPATPSGRGPVDPAVGDGAARPDPPERPGSLGEAPGDRSTRTGASRRAGWGAGRDTRANQDAYETGAAVRALRDLDDLRRELRRGLSGTREELRRELRETLRESLREPSTLLSELLPRVDHLERLLAAGGATAGGSGPAPTDPDSPADPGDDDGPPLTPATGWDAMDRAAAEQAWPALAEFVDTVLYRQYRLSRLQIPDCWPVHPRMVRELAWLRSSYLEAQDSEAEAPAASLPWHIRAVPGFLTNTADAVDIRECRPGIHRLTDPDVSRHATQRMTARHEGRPEPVLTDETGPDRPQLHPEHYPTRSTSTAAAPLDGAEPKPPTVATLPELIVGACHPEHWISYYREASAADLATRP